MEGILEAIIMVILIITFWQDLNTRSVSWICFPALALAFLAYQFLVGNQGSIWNHLLISFGFLALQLSLLLLYLFFRYKSISVISRTIGLGDILFLCSLCFLFSPLNYAAFYLLSLLLVLLISPFFFRLKKDNGSLIPLAGLQSIFLFLLFTARALGASFSFFSDDLLKKLILR